MSTTSGSAVEKESPFPMAPSTASISLLPEIWWLVFPHLKPTDLQSISLTCSTFRYMAQPLLFSVLDVSPFLLSYNAELPMLRPRAYHDRFLKRLDCYKLPHIAHGVRHCWISPYSRSGFPGRNQQDDLDPNLIIKAAVDALPHFPNLSNLSWHCIDIAPEWWDIITSLRITNLWLNSSSIPITATRSLPSVVHLDLDQWPWEGRVTNHVSIHEERSQGVELATLQCVINPAVTESISVPRADTACRLFSVLIDRTNNLRSLNIPFGSVSYPLFRDALEHCPQLESLCILPPSSDERYRDVELDTFSPSALPALTTYEGPYTHVIKFSQQPLSQISLWGFDDRPSLCDPDALVETLAELADTSTVDSLTSVQLTLVSITHDLLEAFGAFTHLERLVIQSQDNSSRNVPMPHLNPLRPGAPVTTLYTMISQIALPTTLKHLKLSTRLSSSRLDLKDQEEEAALFMESVAQKHPAIQRIEIAYGIYWTGMYSAVWGRIRGNEDAGIEGTSGAGGDGLLVAKDRESGYSSKSSSKDYILSTVVSSVHPLPLGKLTFTEHRRTILFQHDTAGVGATQEDGAIDGEVGEGRFWMLAWMKLRRLFKRDWF